MLRALFACVALAACAGHASPTPDQSPGAGDCAATCQQQQMTCVAAANASLTDSGAERRCRAKVNQCLNQCR